ncbi:hypothetical protein MNBD_GAMMA20-1549 [hydrothermal vent metagenome]|uniref:MSHA biogenesis protein MshK n=1 Tax=hydrothermal vent metagenome TaxID=652676 RepID=A0A3B1ARK4_9ZZZZ
MFDTNGIHAGRMVALVLAGILIPGMALAAPLDDPTRPPVAQQPAKAHKAAHKPIRWTLNSTLVSAQRRTAVINERVVGVGEKINGARVVEILPMVVRLHYNGRDITLVLLKKNIKRPSRSGSGKS